FSLYKLCLKALQIFHRLLCASEQSRAVTIRQMLTKEYQKSKRHRGQQDRHQAEFPYGGRIVSKLDGVNRKNRQGYDRSHRQPRCEDAFALFLITRLQWRSIRRIIESSAVLVGDDASRAKPQKRSDQRKIVEASRVIDLQIYRYVDGQRSKHAY